MNCGFLEGTPTFVEMDVPLMKASVPYPRSLEI
jgi:hypothetical protein